MNPDAAFVDFFTGPFQRQLETVDVPGMADASWDRKAAYLLWLATNKGKTLSAPSPAPQPNAGVFD